MTEATKTVPYSGTQSVLITGASSGIGRELAKLFAKDGYSPVLVARRREKLEELSAQIRSTFGIEPRVLTADLSDAGAPEQILDELQDSGTSIEVLVNNAGFGELGRFVDLDVERQVDMIRVNVTALTHLTRLMLPAMLDRDRGGVLNVASTAAFQPGPNMAVYYATKAYVLSFSQALAEELTDTAVRVTCLAPGATETEFAGKSGMSQSKLFQMAKPMSARTVAEAGFRGYKEGSKLVVPGVRNKVGAFATRLLPRSVLRKIVKSLQPVPPSDKADSESEQGPDTSAA